MFSFFSRLKKLTLYDFVCACYQLESLEICIRSNRSDLKSEIILPKITLPNLKKIKIGGKDYDVDSLKSFLARNSHLENVGIRMLSKVMCRFVGQNMPTLRELDIDLCKYDEYEIFGADHMKNLKLKLNSVRYHQVELPIQQLLANNVSVEFHRLEQLFNKVKIYNICEMICIKTLHIELRSEDEIYLLISRLAQNLPNLEKLTIFALDWGKTRLTTEMIEQMLKYANQLSKLYFLLRYTEFPFNEDDYNAISKIVKRRVEHKILKITIGKAITMEWFWT